MQCSIENEQSIILNRIWLIPNPTKHTDSIVWCYALTRLTWSMMYFAMYFAKVLNLLSISFLNDYLTLVFEDLVMHNCSLENLKNWSKLDSSFTSFQRDPAKKWLSLRLNGWTEFYSKSGFVYSFREREWLRGTSYNKQEELTASYRWTAWVWEVPGRTWELQENYWSF
jgi:hypothetical protein